MRRLLRPATVSAAAVALVLGVVTTSASASDGSDPVRATGAITGPVALDLADDTAPVSEDAHPVEPEVELVALDDAEVVDDVAGEDIGGSSQGTDQPETSSDEGEAATPTTPAEEAGATLATSADGDVAATFSAPTPELVIVGVSWESGTAPADLELSWRSESPEGWTEWHEIHLEDEEAPDSEDVTDDTRDGTPPLAVIGSTAVEILMTSGSGELPADATLAVVDPGESTADTDPAVDSGTDGGTAGGSGTAVGGATRITPSAGPVPMAGGTTRPRIHTRAEWGADESMMTWTPRQGRVQGVTIHHTVNTNSYTSAQVPGIIRGIYAYHAQDWGRGWGDIGYNFLVDKFGRIWEGRSGGIDAAPSGAHATGLNSNFAGVSLIGNFETTAVPAAAFAAVAKIAAWKLALHGVTTPNGRVTVDAGTFNRINGHRDSKSTTCPGRYMYNRLPEMRTRIASYIGSFTDRYLDRDLDGDGESDVVTVAAGGAVSLLSTVDQTYWGSAGIGSGWAGSRTVDAGDFNRDGNPDLIHIQSNGAMYLYPGDSSGRVHHETRRLIKTGWQYSDMVIGGVDINGDGYPDLVARRTHGGLVTYFNNGRGGLRPWVDAGSGFGSMERLTLVDDYVDGSPALLAETAGGGLYAYRIRTDGTLASRITVSGSGWRSMRLTTGVGDLTGDGVGDVAAVDSSGRLWLYPGVGGGGLAASSKQLWDTGWGSTIQLIGAGYQWGRPTFYTVDSRARLLIHRRTTAVEAFTTLTPTGLSVASGSKVIPAGDWTWDGVPDLWVITPAGALMLHQGLGDGRFRSTGTRVGTGNWSTYSHVVGAGNWRGDGRPGLLAYQPSTGRIYYHASDGDDFFRTRLLASNGADGMDYLVNAGHWNGSGAPDLLMRGAGTGRLFFYDGNGPGLALPPVVMAPGFGSMSGIVGVNDVTGDRRADLVVLTGSGQLRLYGGNGAGDYRGYRVVGQLPEGSTIS